MSQNYTHEFNFGDDKKLADTLKELVLGKKKTATTGLFQENKKIPVCGEYAAIIDSKGKPFAVVQYTNVHIIPFLEVDYEYVKLEGEGDMSLDEWRTKHRKFFTDNYGDFKDTSLVVCEEFRLVEVL